MRGRHMAAGGAIVPAVAGGIVLAAHTALVMVGVSEAVTLVANLAFASALVVLSVRSGITTADVGLRPQPRGLLAAIAAGSMALFVVLVAAGAGLLPVDPAMAAVSPTDAWFRVIVAIPIGTAVCEEVIFRGVLLAAWDQLMTRRWSTAVVSAQFGLWHVAAEAQRTGALSLGVVPGVLATASASAFVLCPLRRKAGDLAAPVAVHAVTNVAVFVLVYLGSTSLG